MEVTPEGIHTMTVSDREVDIYDMFVLSHEQLPLLLVQPDNDRCLQADEVKRLWSKVELQPIQGERSLRITDNGECK